jgi:hypothetical protein
MRRALLLPCALLLACPSANPPPTGPTTPAPAPSVSAVPSEPPKPVASTPPPAPVVPLEGVAVKAPVFGDDDCNADSDCAPLATCHPDRCVAAGKTGVLPPGTMCTMDCRGGTLDCNFNHCGCAPSPAGKKKCAVLPGAAPPH